MQVRTCISSRWSLVSDNLLLWKKVDTNACIVEWNLRVHTFDKVAVAMTIHRFYLRTRNNKEFNRFNYYGHDRLMITL